MFSIMAVSSLATLFILPAMISINPNIISQDSQKRLGCRCSHCMLISLFVACAVAYILSGYTTVKWRPITFIVIGIVVIFSAICHGASRRKVCLIEEDEK